MEGCQRCDGNRNGLWGWKVKWRMAEQDGLVGDASVIGILQMKT